MKKATLVFSLIFSQILWAQTEYSQTSVPPSTRMPAVSTVDQNKIYENPAQPAEFSLGIDVFRKKLSDALILDDVATDSKRLKTMISFTVERDGTITDVQAKGINANFDAEVKKAVRTVKEKWKPAKIDGRSVRSNVRIPLTMNVE